MSKETFDPKNPESVVYNDSEAQCPYCGWESSDSWEYSDENANERGGGLQCYGCGRRFSLEKQTSVTYVTSPLERDRYRYVNNIRSPETEEEFAERCAKMEEEAREYRVNSGDHIEDGDEVEEGNEETL